MLHVTASLQLRMYGLLTVIPTAAIASPAQAQQVHYDTFTDMSGLVIGGTPMLMPDGSLRLATASTQNYGSITHQQPIALDAFSTMIRFRIQSPGGISDPTGDFGGDGFYLSFGTQPTFAAGVLTGAPLVIQFNTFWNPEVGETGGSNAITALNPTAGFFYNSGVPIETNFDNGDIWTAWIDATSNALEVRVANDGERPAVAQMTLPLSVTDLLASRMGFVSVAAYSGDAVGDHDLLEWTVVPAPGAAAVLAVCGVFVGWRRR